MKNNKKKILVVALLLFVVIGFAGYGVYSYYWTSGDFSNEGQDSTYSDNIIYLNNNFEPQVKQNDEFVFLYPGSGSHSIDLNCSKGSGEAQIICSSDLIIKNAGDASFYYQVLNLNVDGEPVDFSSNPSVEVDGNSCSYESGNYECSRSQSSLGSGSTDTLQISVNGYLTPGSSEAEEVDEPVTFDETVRVSFDLEAVQVHD